MRPAESVLLASALERVKPSDATMSGGQVPPEIDHALKLGASRVGSRFKKFERAESRVHAENA